MTTQTMSQCATCARFRSPLDDDTPAGVTGPYCAAFPDGIPPKILRNAVDHRAAVNGDHGLRWQFKGEPFPEWAFAPEALRAPTVTAEEQEREAARARIVGDYPLDIDEEASPPAPSP